MNDRVEVRVGAATDVGLVREVNEDSYLAEPPVFVVADGMGGHDGGDIASRIVVEEFARLTDGGYDARRGAQAVTETLRQCQRRLDEYGDTHRGSDGGRWRGGTTAVVALLVDDGDQLAAGQPRRLPHLRRSSAASWCGSASTTASCRSWSTRARSPRRRRPSTRSVTS